MKKENKRGGGGVFIAIFTLMHLVYFIFQKCKRRTKQNFKYKVVINKKKRENKGKERKVYLHGYIEKRKEIAWVKMVENSPYSRRECLCNFISLFLNFWNLSINYKSPVFL